MFRLFMKLLFTIGIVLCTAQSANAQEHKGKHCYKVAYAENIEASEIFVSVFRKIYKDAGICAEFAAMPYKRADNALRQGLVDANALRTKTYIDSTPYAAYINTPVLSISSYLFGTKQVTNVLPRHNSSAKIHRPIGYMASNHWAEQIAKDISTHATAVRSYPQLIAMLQTGRIDGFIIDDLNFNLITKSNSLNLSAYKRRFIAAYPLYHVLDKKHVHLLPALSQSIEKAVAENAFMAAYERWLGKTDNFYLKFSTTSSKDRYPFTIGIGGDKERTLLYEAIAMILNDTPYTPKRFDVATTSRVDALKSGAVDFIVFSPSWLPDGKPFTNTRFSAPLYPISDSLICQSDMREKITALDDIYSYEIGTITGYKYFDQARLKRRDFPSEESLLKALDDNKISCGIIGTLNFKAYDKRNNTSLITALIHSQGTLNILMRSELKDILDNINNVIIEKQKDGELEALLQDYIAQIAQETPD